MSAFDQLPDGWSTGARGYATQFMDHTRPFAADAIDLLGLEPGTTLLDVAAGTGAATLDAAARGISVIATDFAPGMVDELRRLAAEQGVTDAVTAEVMDGQALTLPDDSVDGAISMFGWMFFPSTDAGLAELRRVVRPDGRIALGIWNLASFQLRQLITAAMAEVRPDLTLDMAAPRWARLGDPAVFTAEVEAAGFVDVAVHTVSHRWSFADPRSYFLTMGEWTPVWKPVMDLLADDERSAMADGFVEVVRAAEATPEGVTSAADICLGTVPD